MTLSRKPGNESSVHSGSKPWHDSHGLPACVGQDRVEHGQVRAEGEAHRELGRPAAHAEHDAGLLAGERTIGVAGVGERSPDDLERDQLSGLDRRQARRGHPVANRVERDVGKKPAPLRDDLVGSLGIGVVIEPPVPAVRRDFGDGIDAA